MLLQWKEHLQIGQIYPFYVFRVYFYSHRGLFSVLINATCQTEESNLPANYTLVLYSIINFSTWAARSVILFDLNAENENNIFYRISFCFTTFVQAGVQSVHLTLHHQMMLSLSTLFYIL